VHDGQQLSWLTFLMYLNHGFEGGEFQDNFGQLEWTICLVNSFESTFRRRIPGRPPPFLASGPGVE